VGGENHRPAAFSQGHRRRVQRRGDVGDLVHSFRFALSNTLREPLISFRFQCQGSANDRHPYADLTRHSGLGAKAAKLTKNAQSMEVN
jgi:hypothetical protein